MVIENWKISDVKPYENNPRNNNEAVQYVANSISEFGWNQPIVVDRNGVIIVGHTRYKAAMLLGMEFVPVLVAHDLSEQQAAAYRIADNKTGEIATWDIDALKIELSKITDIDLSSFCIDVDLDSGDAIDLQDPSCTCANDSEGHIIHCPKCGFEFEV